VRCQNVELKLSDLPKGGKELMSSSILAAKYNSWRLGAIASRLITEDQVVIPHAFNAKTKRGRKLVLEEEKDGSSHGR
jgi:hypothetical protein